MQAMVGHVTCDLCVWRCNAGEHLGGGWPLPCHFLVGALSPRQVRNTSTSPLLPTTFPLLHPRPLHPASYPASSQQNSTRTPNKPHLSVSPHQLNNMEQIKNVSRSDLPHHDPPFMLPPGCQLTLIALQPPGLLSLVLTTNSMTASERPPSRG